MNANETSLGDRFWKLVLFAEFGYSICQNSETMPALEGSPAEIHAGETARADYLARFDAMWFQMAKVAENHIGVGGYCYDQVLSALENVQALHNKIMDVCSAGWWEGMGVDLEGHPEDDFKKLAWVLRFYAQSA